MIVKDEPSGSGFSGLLAASKMSVVERALTYLVLPPSASCLSAGDKLSEFTLVSGPKTHFSGFTWKVEFPFPQAYRVLVTGPDRPRPPHDNASAPATPCHFTLLSLDREKCSAVLVFPRLTTEAKCIAGLDDAGRLELRIRWGYQVFSEVHHVGADGDDAVVVRDLQARSYALTDHGMIRHWSLDRNRLHLGLGEKAAPIDLTGRRFTLHATDAAWYDTYRTDPLYKHTPFLVSTPRPTPDPDHRQGLTYAIFHATNSVATWDVGCEIDFPSGGWSKRYVQDWGGLEEWVMVGRGVQGVVQTFAEVAGKPRLVGRDWMGYLGA